MKKIEFELKGNTALLMNSNQGVNPLHPLTKKMKVLTAKRKRTEEDDTEILHLKWQLGLYWDDVIGIHVPAVNVEGMFRDSAKSVRKGTVAKLSSAISVSPDLIPLITPEGTPTTKDGLWDDPNGKYADVKVGKIKQASVLLCRPRFDGWSLKFILAYDESKFDRKEVVELMEKAGRDVGLCDYRGKYGMFSVASAKDVKV